MTGKKLPKFEIFEFFKLFFSGKWVKKCLFSNVWNQTVQFLALLPLATLWQMTLGSIIGSCDDQKKKFQGYVSIVIFIVSTGQLWCTIR